MEGNYKVITVPVALKGSGNYLLWSRLVKTAIGRLGLWSHITDEAPKPVAKEGEGGEGDEDQVAAAEKKWIQEDLMVLSVLQGSLEVHLLDAYSYCETPKHLWETLLKTFGNTTNLSRVFELKRAINNLAQEEEEFSKHLGKYRSLWSEVETLRPSTIDQETLMERREQDQVFGLMLTLNPAFGDVIKHILRSPNLPSMEEVCAQLQKEEGTLGLFGRKGDMALSNKAEAIQANKAAYRGEERKFSGNCDHCKKPGHKRSQCWILHPHLKPAKFNKEREGRAHLSAETSEAGASGAGSSGHAGESEGRALTSHHQGAGKNMEHEMIRKSDIDALIKALKESGNTLGNTLGYSYAAHVLPRTCNRLLENLDNTRIESDSYKTFAADRMSRNESTLLDIINKLKLVSKSPRNHIAQGIKPLIIDSGASHHMISDDSLIKNIEPAHGHVMIANGDRIPIRGVGDLKMFNKDSKALYIPEFTSNLLSVKRCTNDLQCNVIFSPNDVKFQDIENSKLIGQGVTKGDIYLLEDISLISSSSCLLSSVLSRCALWHSRLGHPHVRALSLMLPRVIFKNNECEACILGKHCKTVFKRSTTIYDKCFDLIHSDVWTAPCLSRDNYKYFVTFIDEKSKYTWITLIKTKDRVLDAFKNFQSYVSNQYNAKIKIFRSDNGGEYTGSAFKNHLAQNGILHQTSCPYTPQQNGVAERKNRHLMEVAKSMMFQMRVPKRFWSDVVITACYLINRIPTRILEDKAPYEVLNNSKPVLDHLRVFGCISYVLVPGEMRNKLEAKSVKAMMIGTQLHRRDTSALFQKQEGYLYLEMSSSLKRRATMKIKIGKSWRICHNLQIELQA
ncbi:uncharacterized protein LOC103873924 isoform X1 [Brassica rapa]|uniref:uncharacterized protein LOC103873924 isoform X1 n=1 Tax=Brassica campestris TaxID=3711 RepID=UPI00142DEC76|nr:uncharacterized protein LOC103873924 isoform X1 [Brassica rapa]